MTTSGVTTIDIQKADTSLVDFLNSKGIKHGWDFKDRGFCGREQWHEIYFEGEEIIQVDFGCTKDAFIKTVEFYYTNPHSKRFEDDGMNVELTWSITKDREKLGRFLELIVGGKL